MTAVGEKLVAEHAWQSGDEGDLRFVVGAEIEIISLAPGGGWVTGKLADGTTGIFPSNYARPPGLDSPIATTRARAATAPSASDTVSASEATIVRQRSELLHPAGGGASPPVQYVAAHTFDPQGQASCIALVAGEGVVVTDSSRDDWWQGYRVAEPTELGSFPKAYVKRADPAATVAVGLVAQTELGAAEIDSAAQQAADAEAAAQKAAADTARRAEQEAEVKKIQEAQAEENARMTAEQEAAASREKAEAEAAVAAALKHELALLADVAQHAKELLEGGSQSTARSAILTAVTTKFGTAVIEEAVPPAQSPEPEPAHHGAPPPPSPGNENANGAQDDDAAIMAEGARAAERAAILTESRSGVAPPRPRMPTALNSDILRFSVAANHTNHFRAKKTKGFMGIFGRRHLTTEELAAHTDTPIDQPLLVGTPKNASQDAVDNFRNIMIWMDELPQPGGHTIHKSGGGRDLQQDGGHTRLAWGADQFAAAGAVLRLAMGAEVKFPQLIDEMYCQICKQTATNPSPLRRTRGLGLLLLLANVAMPCEKEIRASTIRMTDRLLAGSNFERTSSNILATTSTDTEPVPATHTLRLCRALLKILNNDAAEAVRIFPTGMGGSGLTDMLVAKACEIVSGYVMGVQVESLVDRRRILAAQPTATLPEVLEQLVSLIRKKAGHSLEGIFRVSGSKESTDELLTVIDLSGDHPQTASIMATTGPFVAATALKQWLGALSEPVFPFAM